MMDGETVGRAVTAYNCIDALHVHSVGLVELI